MTEFSPPPNCFWPHFTSELVASCFRRQRNNFDDDRFKDGASPRGPIKKAFLDLGAKVGFHRYPGKFADVSGTPGLDVAYGLLEDQPSRDLFVKLLVYRTLGHEQVCLPRNNADYWSRRRSLPNYRENGSGVRALSVPANLDRYDMNGVRLYTDQWGALNTFLLEQYRCARAGIGVEAGDTVIDGGGCFGDTALYFAQKADQVYCFECMPANVAVARENLALNPALAGKIRVVEKALWSSSGKQFIFKQDGPASRPGSGSDGVAVTTQSIDDLVRSAGLERVDFIKMDIEGAEPEALLGAEATLKAFRPRLAVCVYHDVRHFSYIPQWLAGLNLGYRFYLDHFTIHQEETVLFAQAGQ